MILSHIARLYEQGRDAEAREYLAREIARAHADPESMEPPTYEPTEADIDDAEAEYYAARRTYRYGSPERQMEFITEHGLEAWQAEVARIKGEVAKP